MKKHYYHLIFFLIVLISAHTLIFAQKKISYDGYVSSGWKVEYKGFGESFYRAKVQLEVKPNDNYEAQVDIRGRSDRREVELREINVTFKHSESTRLKIGNLKRTFGLEEMTSRERLFTVERSLIYRHLSPMGYVGRNLTLQVYHGSKEKDSSYSLYFSVSYNESRTPSANARISIGDVMGLSTVGFNAVYQQQKGELIFDTPLDAFAISTDVTKEIERYHGDIEIFFGKDPLEMRIKRLIGQGTSVYFTGIKSLHAYRFAFTEKILHGIEPVILFSFLAPNSDDFNVNQYQVVVGTNLYFDKDVRLLVNGDLISSNSRYNKETRSYFGSSITAELQLRW